MKYAFIIFLFIAASSVTGQEVTSSILFEFSVNNEKLALNNHYAIPSSYDSILISKARFYLYNSDLTVKTPTTHYLIDAEHDNYIPFPMQEGKDSHVIFFNIGVDTLVQYQGAQAGALDPMHGMYWTWKNGYVHFKLEGTFTRSNGEKEPFTYHIGGYQSPNNTVIEVRLEMDQKNRVQIELDTFLKHAQERDLYNIMSPGKAAMELVQVFKYMFKSSLID